MDRATSSRIDTGSRIEQALLKPFRIAWILATGALIMSLAFLSYTAWSSVQRLQPLERHLDHVQQLQEISLRIQELILRKVDLGQKPTINEITELASKLQSVDTVGKHLNRLTPMRLEEAYKILTNNQIAPEDRLRSALRGLQQALSAENLVQRQASLSARSAAELELRVAAFALVMAPLSAMLLLLFVRRHSLHSLGQLSAMLENVGNLEFDSMRSLDPSDPFFDVFKRYNVMTEKLRHARSETERQQDSLESQVRIATETLMRQQIALADGARLAAIGEFSARVAHELRNPVSGIMLALRNLEPELTDADHRERINLVLEELDRINRLLESLLEQTPRTAEIPVPLNIRQVAENMMRLFRYQVPDDITLEIDAEDLVCDLPRDTLRQVLLNLLRNAADALKASGHGVIRIEARHSDNAIRFAIIDSGPGFPSDLLAYGVRPYTTQKAQGTGLGLSVIKRLVRSVGGELELSNEPTGGARATFILPCREKQHADHDDHRR